MNLGELLSELRVNILNDRSDRASGSSDYLWTDETLVRYINEAQRRFATRALVIRDGSSEATEVTLVADQAEYELDPAVIAVLSAKVEGQQRDLLRVGHSLLGTFHRPDATFYDPSQYDGLPPGQPLAFTTDERLSVDAEGSVGVVTLRVYPVPDAAAAATPLRLRVVRKPAELALADLDGVSEVPEDHHLDMLTWAAYLALRIVDADAGNPKRAAEFAAVFEQHVREARTLVMRKLFAPSPWGFGRNGFAWEA